MTKEETSILARIHRAFFTRCPYCDRRQEVTEVDVFVEFRRKGTCFTRCKRCFQIFCVDEEIERIKND